MIGKQDSKAKEKVALVTGAGGFMGSHMVELLKEKGYTVLATDIVLPKEPLPWDMFKRADLAEPNQIENLVEAVSAKYGAVDAVFHIAGLFDYSASREQLYRVNVETTFGLFMALKYRGLRPRIIVWSAAGIYDFAETPTPQNTKGISEDWPVKPQGHYLQSKYEGECMALYLGDHFGFCVSALRPGGVYGPRSRYGVATSIFLAANGMMGPFLMANKENRGGTVHARDVCRAALFLAEQPRELVSGQVFNAADDSKYTIADLSRFIAKEVGFPFLPAITLPLKLMDKMTANLAKKAEKKGRLSILNSEMSALLKFDSLLDTGKLKKLGWLPKCPDAKIGLVQTIAAYQKEGWINSQEFNKKRDNIMFVVLAAFAVLLDVLIVSCGFLDGTLGVWTFLLAFLSIAALATFTWLIYRLVFVVSGFNNLDLWTNRKS